MANAKRWLIEPYVGYGTRGALYLSGRVLEDKGVIESAKLDSKWRNLRNTFRRFRTGEISGVRVRARYRGVEAEAVTDAEGYYRFTIAPPPEAPLSAWEQVALEIDSGAESPATAGADILVPPQTARFGVISDIDDTVVRTNVTSTAQMLATVLFSNPHVRTPFEGICAFYAALHAGAGGTEGNPIFYVSNGPWNFYGLLVEFFKLNKIPLGPIFLRDFGARMLFSSKARHGPHKLQTISAILETYPALPFVLIGDSGERDPEIYADIVKRYPGRIRAIYIRSVDRSAERLAALAALAETVRRTTVQFVIASDSAAAATHAAAEGLIAPTALQQIGEAVS